MSAKIIQLVTRRPHKERGSANNDAGPADERIGGITHHQIVECWAECAMKALKDGDYKSATVMFGCAASEARTCIPPEPPGAG